MNFEKFLFSEELQETMEVKAGQVLSLIQHGELDELSGVLSSLNLASDICQAFSFQEGELERMQKKIDGLWKANYELRDK